MVERGIAEGVSLFNSGKYFEAHEALEAVWLKASGRRKTFLHGLIQVAAAFHHYTHGNPAGFRSLLAKGCVKLESFGAATEGVDLGVFMLELRQWREHLEAMPNPSLPTPPLPQVKLLERPQRG